MNTSTLVFFAIVVVPGSAALAQMGPLDLTWSTIDCGGAAPNATVSGGVFTLHGAIGQPDAGTLAGGAFEVRGGFWTGTPGPAPCYPDCNGDGALNLADFGCFQTKFALSDPYADCNGDGVLNLADFGCYQTRFALGCP